MKSLRIITTKENKKDFTIYFENRESLSILKETYFKFSIYELEVIDEDLVNEIKDQNELINCEIIAKRNLAGGSKSSTRLFHLLENKGFKTSIIESIMIKLKEEERINDMLFSKKFIKKKIKTNKISSNMLISLLVNEGIDEKLSIELVEKEKIDNYKIAKNIVNKKFKNIVKDDEKIYRFLSTKGFEQDIIFSVIGKENE